MKITVRTNHHFTNSLSENPSPLDLTNVMMRDRTVENSIVMIKSSFLICNLVN